MADQMIYKVHMILHNVDFTYPPWSHFMTYFPSFTIQQTCWKNYIISFMRLFVTILSKIPFPSNNILFPRSYFCLCVHECSVTSVVSSSFVTPWMVTGQSPLSMEFSRQEYWGGLPCHTPGDLPNTGTEPASPSSPILQADSFHWGARGDPYFYMKLYLSAWLCTDYLY